MRLQRNHYKSQKPYLNKSTGQTSAISHAGACESCFSSTSIDNTRTPPYSLFFYGYTPLKGSVFAFCGGGWIRTPPFHTIVENSGIIGLLGGCC